MQSQESQILRLPPTGCEMNFKKAGNDVTPITLLTRADIPAVTFRASSQN